MMKNQHNLSAHLSHIIMQVKLSLKYKKIMVKSLLNEIKFKMKLDNIMKSYIVVKKIA